MPPLVKLGLLGVALAGVAACAHVQAAAPGPSPLDVPAPPPHVVVPPTPDVSDVKDPAPPTTPAPVAPPHAAAVSARTPDKPATSPTTATVPPPEPATTAATTAGASLETTSDTNALENQTNALIQNAKHDLMRVDRQALGADTRAQYERAQGFVKQAENALREKNFTYARNMAEKAAVLASQLSKTRS